MLKGIYPGSFDPVTYGHLDVIERSSKLVDELMKNEVEKSGAKSQGGEVCTINEISEMRPE